MSVRSSRGSSEHESSDAPVSRSRWSDLPTEIWQSIIDLLAPSFDLYFCTFPHPYSDSSDFRPCFSQTLYANLVPLASTCKRLNTLANQAIYRTLCLPGFGYRSRLDPLSSFCTAVIGHHLAKTMPIIAEDAVTRWVRALDVPAFTTWPNPLCLSEPASSFYGCPTSFLLGACTGLRYLFLNDDEDFHSLLHLLSSATRCQPTHLTHYVQNHQRKRLALPTATSLASLARLTHLHLMDFTSAPSLASILLGLPNPAHDPASVRKLDQTTPMHCKTLECLRLSGVPVGALRGFATYVAWRDARENDPEVEPQDFYFDPPTHKYQQALYELACNLGRIPCFRLLIIEIDGRFELMPSSLGHRFVMTSEELMGHSYPGQECRYSLLEPSRSHSPWLNAAIRKSTSHPTYIDDLSREERFRWYRDNETWRTGVEDVDYDWEEIHSGKLELIRLWKRSQLEHATKDLSKREGEQDGSLVDREIRITVGRELHGLHMRKFWCEATNLGPTNADEEGGRARTHQGQDTQQSRAPAKDVGCWADQDVFALAEEKPWLSYRLHPDKSCAFWTGLLPRKSEPVGHANADPAAQATGAGLEIPEIIDLSESALDEQGRRELDQLRARSDE